MMRDKTKMPPIIVKRRRHFEEEDENHGTWKIAYADFTTAMMAFFLLMWLVSVISETQREGLTDYFNPVAVSRSNSGGEGMLDGRSIDTQGSLTSQNAEGTRAVPVSAPPVVSEIGDEERAPYVGDDLTVPEGLGEKPLPGQDTETAAAFEALSAAAQTETAAFDRLEERILNAIESDPAMQDLLAAVLFERTPEGLRIQLTDQHGFSMFEVGGTAPKERARKLLGLVGMALSRVPNQVVIEGHTDARAYAGEGYSNWELSAGRANAARRLLVANGVAATRVDRVEGSADRRPLVREDALDPRNRRIAVEVLRQTPLPVDLLPALTNKYRK